MDKLTFINTLKKELRKRFDSTEVDSALHYYEEIIEDRKEQGEREEAIIQSFGSIDEILSELSLTILSKQEGRSSLKKTVKSGALILALCASPVLLPLGLAFAGVFFGVSLAILSILFALIVTGISLAFALIPATITLIVTGGETFEIVFSIAMFLIAVAIILFLGAFVYKYGVVLLLRISKKFSKWMLKYIHRKDDTAHEKSF